jgi:hypothetical protein
MFARQIRQRLQARHRIGTNALKASRQQCEVGVHAFRAQLERHVERRLIFIERRVGGALQFVRRGRGVRKDYRLAEAVPEAAEGKQPEQAGEEIRQKGEAGSRGHGQAEWLQSEACYLHL